MKQSLSPQLRQIYTAISIMLLFLLPQTAMASCNEKPSPLPLPSNEEIGEIISYLNSKEYIGGKGHNDFCAGHYSRNENCLADNDPYCARWNINCDHDGLAMAYTLFKGDFANNGQNDYLLASEGGTGHYDSLEAILRKDKVGIVAIKTEGALPGGPEFSAEAVAMPGHLGDPFLTEACGVVYMNFEDYSWTANNIRKMTPVVYQWKGNELRHISGKNQ